MRSSFFRFIAFPVVFLLATPLLFASSAASGIVKELKGMRSLSDDKRPAATRKVAEEIRALPAGEEKVQLAANVCGLATEGDQGQDTIQAVAETLAQALSESPVPAKKDEPPYPYRELANIAHYMQAKVTLSDPLYAKAVQQLIDRDAAVQKADFTLENMHGKKITLSQ